MYKSGLPILGICYGEQRLIHDQGGKVEFMEKREQGRAEVKLLDNYPAPTNPAAVKFLKAVKPSFMSYMSHIEQVTRIPSDFTNYAVSACGSPAIIIHNSKPWIGTQFHPEIYGCDDGELMIRTFVIDVCGCRPDWTTESYAKEQCRSIKEKAGNNPVLLPISGGVDSAVTGAVLLKALGPEQVHLLYIDTGLMRKNETADVKAKMERLGAKHIHVVSCEDEFFTALKGIVAPEEKRRVIRVLYNKIQEREAARIGLPENYFLAQSTIYTDTEECDLGPQGRVLKSHHNFRGPLAQAKRGAGRLIEPLGRLYKYEVRRLGLFLRLDSDWMKRHPFPDTGLAVRVIGEATKTRCAILREVDAVFTDELKARKGASGRCIYDEVWQAFPVLLPVCSTGIADNGRSYSEAVSLRAITSLDSIVAEPYQFSIKDLLAISSRITNEVKEVNRVTYDITAKPPATIEWE
jgi:GMP synthase (glutamine-hydrolysing)